MTTLEEVRAAHARLHAWYKANKDPASGLDLDISNWTYDGDEHVEAVEPRPIVFMGFNPGSGEGAIVNTVGRGERTWRTRCANVSGLAPDQIVFAELVSLPTRNQAGLKADEARLEAMMAESAILNRAIIGFHKPRMVFQTGLTAMHLRMVEKLYGLTFRHTHPRPHRPTETLAHSYVMADGTPWIAFRHFASQGYSRRDSEGVRGLARSFGWNPPAYSTPLIPAEAGTQV